ncbi:cell division protein ZapA [Geochorda subterranea]|uniref:Cell division protein ZapA n=1 Tax=Geochorda subterranea TaxID=3109564 RepID=A0ABZ1BSE6_9FIRM|nr:cell division protein ZapA [Limnochorda sp. LNt]WRP15679.1 cell division protein ZapA [Limnochorda sp. LNt]
MRIAGSEYVLRGPASASEIRALAEELDRRLQAVIEANPRLALHQAMVLCALEILEELHRLRRSPAADTQDDRPTGRSRRERTHPR